MNGNSAVDSKSLISAINMCSEHKLNTYKFITFGMVKKVNDNYTIDVQPLASHKVTDKEGKGTYIDYPIIYGVPYLFLITPHIGDNCILLHLDTNISAANNIQIIDGVQYVKGSNTAHSLNNCVAICGFKNIAENLQRTNKDDETIKSEADSIADTAGSVLYSLQTLTAEQQQQARTNISAQAAGTYANASGDNITNVSTWQSTLNNLQPPDLEDLSEHTQTGQAVVVESFLSSDKKSWYRKWSRWYRKY